EALQRLTNSHLRPDVLILEDAAIDRSAWNRLVFLRQMLESHLRSGRTILSIGTGFNSGQTQADQVGWLTQLVQIPGNIQPVAIGLDIKEMNLRQISELLTGDSNLSSQERIQYARLVQRWIPPYPSYLLKFWLPPDIVTARDAFDFFVSRYQPRQLRDEWKVQGLEVISLPPFTDTWFPSGGSGNTPLPFSPSAGGGSSSSDPGVSTVPLPLEGSLLLFSPVADPFLLSERGGMMRTFEYSERMMLPSGR
ncbi:MAG: hypothetical protein Q7S00_02140, partial [bacterium]|nr:hypothetical protein [bacterium]